MSDEPARVVRCLRAARRWPTMGCGLGPFPITISGWINLSAGTTGAIVASVSIPGAGPLVHPSLVEIQPALAPDEYLGLVVEPDPPVHLVGEVSRAGSSDGARSSTSCCASTSTASPSRSGRGWSTSRGCAGPSGSTNGCDHARAWPAPRAPCPRCRLMAASPGGRPSCRPAARRLSATLGTRAPTTWA